MRAAPLVVACPQPDVVGQQERDAAFTLARQHQERLVSRPLQYRRALGGARVDQAEPAAPARWILVSPLQSARHRMAFAEFGEACTERHIGGAAAWLGGQNAFERG